ncbi:MAG: flagellar basal-body MS-ring/collar protein FliF [Aliarcobacter sp.]|uniref:Flagellar M-ring protein n=1 Tax=Arcobacter aquimarinus TaxID=1315211 RepID=A0AAE7B3H3_9BACT|nr:flagellar basal-body MS-ring/collar protein FliF [Arcobacter aquimarinus]MCB9097128.1 flagellar M-ring protein FliF [Arcobacter sp.]QKE26823.1 flagellar inner membrane MS-ring protein FliF [Arcobacter aquimarinus]RXI32194.1 flagellar M-ring protein FliF [Arcobacter aquimarinus]
MDQLLKFINNLNTAQRAVIIGGFSLLFILLVGLLIYSSIKAEDKKLNYTIASNLTKSQVMLASDELEAAGIQFSVVGSGNNLTLKTSKEFINIAKIKLVTSEAATSKHVGWEIFEKSSLGTTNFENKVKYLRALEGELSRSLESLTGVLRASVKIAIPKDTIFTEKKADTTASAVLSLKPGIFLTQKQIDGIKNFIASAVPDLKEENIQLIDQDGSLLELSSEDINNQKSSTQNKYKEDLEEDYSKKIVALLEPFVGVGRVVAKVTVSLDFVKKDIEEEIYNPEGSIRSQQVIENTSASQGMPNNSGGVAGVDNNIQTPNNGNGNANIASNSEGTNTVTNYEISKKIISQKDNNYTNIKRITAAVTFDDSVLKDIQNKDEFITSLESVIQDTIGYDQARGDKVTVKDFKFIGVKPIEQIAQTVDKDGNVVVISDEPVDTISMVKSVIKDFSEYIQYLIAAVLLFIFYKKFIASNEIVILGDGTKQKVDINDENLVNDMLTDYENEFDASTAQGRLKSKVKSQILNNIDGLDEESAARYEIFIEELDREINNNPAEIARMIELLLNEGNSSFK